MGYAVLRVQKLKSGVAVRASMRHAFREQETPNADHERTPDNTHIGAKSVSEAMRKFNAAMPEKVRKNAVLAVEYLITGSPEDILGKTRQEQDAYFQDALKWLQAKHGKENLLYAGVHRDETTPHLYAYIMPKDAKGKLNCRAVLGGHKSVLSQLQTDFADQVGKQHGLERGIEGSRAKHVEIKQYYARVKAAEKKPPNIDVPEPTLGERLNPQRYGNRVANSVISQLTPTLSELNAKATELVSARLEATEAKAAQKLSQQIVEPVLNALRPLKTVPEKLEAIESFRDFIKSTEAKRQAEFERQRQQAELKSQAEKKSVEPRFEPKPQQKSRRDDYDYDLGR